MRHTAKLLKKAKQCEVTPLDRGMFRVKSPSGKEYLVRLQYNVDGAVCNCKWGQYRRHADHYRSGCAHTLAVYLAIEARRVSAWPTKEAARRQHRPMQYIGDDITLTLRKSDT